MVELKGYKVNSLFVENKAKPGTQLKLQNQLKYNVNYIDGKNICVGVMELRIIDTELNPFELKLEMAAEFSYSPEDERADIHTTSFDQLFPFVRQIIHNATSYTGMNGLLIPIMKLDRSSIISGGNAPTETSPLN